MRVPTGPAALLTHITALRIALVPVIMGLVLKPGLVGHSVGLATALFAVAAVTDYLDGYLARRWRATSALGSFLDTTADKLLVSGVLIALVGADRASAWLAAVIIGREIVILGLRGVVALDGLLMRPSLWGKAKATVQFGAVGLAILRPPLEVGPLLLDEWVIVAAAIVTVVSGAEYLVRFWEQLSGEKSRGGGA